MSHHYGNVNDWMNPQSSAAMVGQALPLPSMYEIKPMAHTHTKHSYFRTMILTVLHPHAVACLPFAVTALDAHGYKVSIASRGRAAKEASTSRTGKTSRGTTANHDYLYETVTVPSRLDSANRDAHIASQFAKQVLYSYSRVVQPFSGVRNDVVHITLGTAICSFNERGANTGAHATLVRTFGELPSKVQELMRQLNVVGSGNDQRVFTIPVPLYSAFVEKLQALVPFVHRMTKEKHPSKKVRFAGQHHGGGESADGLLLLMEPDNVVERGGNPYDVIRSWTSWIDTMSVNRRKMEGIDLEFMIGRHGNLLNPVMIGDSDRDGGASLEEGVKCVKALAFIWSAWLFSSYDLAELWYTFAQLSSVKMPDELRNSRVISWKGIHALWKLAGDDMLIQFVHRMVRANMGGRSRQPTAEESTREQAKTSVFRVIRAGFGPIQAGTDKIFGPLLVQNATSVKEALMLALGVHAFIAEADKRIGHIKRESTKQLVVFSQDEKNAILFPWIRALSQRHISVRDMVVEVARDISRGGAGRGDVNKDVFMQKTLEMGETQTALVLYRYRHGKDGVSGDADAGYPVKGYDQWFSAMMEEGRSDVSEFMDQEAYVDDFGFF